jgi:AraC-like DNA-binding protein
MSSSGHFIRPEAVRSVALNLPEGGRVPSHRHDWDQLVFAVSGVMTVETGQRRWVVPPQRAVWLPATLAHRIDAPGPLALRTLYFAPGAVTSLPRRGCVVGVPPLLRELIAELVRRPRPDATRRKLVELIGDMLAELSQEPLTLPMPRDPSARRLAELLARHPDDRRPLERLAPEVGASTRTLQRRFQSETGMSFRHWRQQLRLHRGLVLLAEGVPVTAVALQVGYESPSAFVAMFRQLLGSTPGSYFRQPGASHEASTRRVESR